MDRQGFLDFLCTMKTIRKHWAIFQITLLNGLAYPREFVGFLILLQSLSFWMGMVSSLTNLAVNAMITFGIYPTTLFDNFAKLILFTVIPAALMGAVPAEFILSFNVQSLAQMLAGAFIFLFLAVTMFRLSLKRYESGSAIQIEV